MLLTCSIIITGKVQGVFYRQSTKEKALALGLTGNVMNLPDQSVKIIATGTKEQLDQLINWCRQGPPKARVESVTAIEVESANFSTFTIVRPG